MIIIGLALRAPCAMTNSLRITRVTAADRCSACALRVRRRALPLRCSEECHKVARRVRRWNLVTWYSTPLLRIIVKLVPNVPAGILRAHRPTLPGSARATSNESATAPVHLDHHWATLPVHSNYIVYTVQTWLVSSKFQLVGHPIHRVVNVSAQLIHCIFAYYCCYKYYQYCFQWHREVGWRQDKIDLRVCQPIERIDYGCWTSVAWWRRVLRFERSQWDRITWCMHSSRHHREEQRTNKDCIRCKCTYKYVMGAGFSSLGSALALNYITHEFESQVGR